MLSLKRRRRSWNWSNYLTILSLIKLLCLQVSNNMPRSSAKSLRKKVSQPKHAMLTCLKRRETPFTTNSRMLSLEFWLQQTFLQEVSILKRSTSSSISICHTSLTNISTELVELEDSEPRVSPSHSSQTKRTTTFCKQFRTDLKLKLKICHHQSTRVLTWITELLSLLEYIFLINLIWNLKLIFFLIEYIYN